MEINLLHPQAFEKRQQLDWPIFMEKVKKHCFFGENHYYFEKPLIYKPNDQAKLEAHYQRVEKMMNHLLESKGELFHSYALSELNEEYFIRLEKNATLTLKEINTLCLLVEGFETLMKSDIFNLIVSENFKAPERYRELTRLLKFIRKYVDTKGEIITENDPRLLGLIEKIYGLENKVRLELQRLTSDPAWQDRLQHKNFDIINDHYVLLIKSDSYQSSLGDIISHSQTGASLFIEPHIIKDLSTKILLSKRELERFIQKICLDISQKLFDFQAEIKNIKKLCFDLDKISAQAKFNLEFDLKKPEFSTGNVELINFFHPLLENPVRNHFILSSQDQGALISGPNTGGKTVCLKVFSLTQMLAQSGFFVPADSATITLYDHLYFLGNDDQGVEEGLSSFSSEIKNYLQVLEENLIQGSHKPKSLIIIDEIFNSTSSEEASALALGFIEQFTKNSHNRAIISSHHSALKNSIFEKKSLQSFHMGFKKPDNIPTYKLIQGSPGSSMAIEVFERLAPPTHYTEAIKKVAFDQLENQHTKYEQLISELSDQKSQMESLQTKLENSQQDFLKQKESYRHALKMQSDIENDQILKSYNNLKAQFTRLKKQKHLSEGSVQKFTQESRELEEKLTKPQAVSRGEQFSLKEVSNFREGEFYFSKSIGQIVRLIKIQGRKAQANLGKLKVNVQLSDLFQPPKNSKIEPVKNKVVVRVSTHTQFSTDYDCRGMRLSEFENQLFQVLQGLSLKEIPYLRIIHGHGNGTLKSFLRNYLKKQNEFSYEVCKDSADGATLIKLS